MRILLRLLVLAAFAAGAAVLPPLGSTARADPAISFDRVNGFQLTPGAFTIGWTFTVNQALGVSALGAYDSPLAEGLLDSHEIGIWNSSGQLLASATVQGGTASPLIGGFRYAYLASDVTLDPGTYTIGATWPANRDGAIFPSAPVLANVAVDPLIAFGQAVFAGGSSLSQPTDNNACPAASPSVPCSSTDYAYFGPNFLIPEPGTIALLGAGLFALGLLRRRRRA